MSITSYHGIGAHDNPKESIGKRHSHLCRTFHDIASIAADDEELTEYAHQSLVNMLEGLEEIKKNRGDKEGTSSSDSSKEKSVFDENEDVEGIIESNTCATTIVRGVKRKATVGRPRTRFKDPTERKKGKVHKKTTKAPTRRKITMQVHSTPCEFMQ